MIGDQKEIFDITGIPYYKIPSVAKDFTPETTAARMIDGLGFRYYWATEGLTSKDFEYRVDANSRSCEETMEHIYELSITLYNWVTNDVVLQKKKESFLDPQQLRAETLQNILQTSVNLKTKKLKLAKLNRKMKDGSDLPFWFAINGPISDALWHTGQIVMMRRASGNPISPGVNVLRGVKN